MNVNVCYTQSLMRICAKKRKEEEEVILDLLLSEAIHSQDAGAIIFSLLPIIFTSIVFNFDRSPLNFPTEFCKFSCLVSLLMCIFLQLTQSQECKAERLHLQSRKYIGSIQTFLQNLPCILYFQEERLTHRGQLVL